MLLDRLLASPALSLPLVQRAKFEGWLKVELGRGLVQMGYEVTLESPVPGTQSRADLGVIADDNTLIMLKTVNTNYRFPDVWQRTRPITKNISGVAEDVVKLQHRIGEDVGLAVPVVFPLSKNHRVSFEVYLKRVVSAGARLVAEGHVSPPCARSNWTASWFMFDVPTIPVPPDVWPS